MKKNLFALLVLTAAVFCLLMSCSAEIAENIAVEDAVGYFRFGDEYDSTRSFSAEYDIQEYEDLYWFYTAAKADSYGKTGVKEKEEPVTKDDGNPLKGLTGTIGPFSQGKWNFTLKAYTTLAADGTQGDESTLVYENDGVIEATLRGGETKSITANVKASGETGFLSFRKTVSASETDTAFFKWNMNDSSQGKPMFMIRAYGTTKGKTYILTNDSSVTKESGITYIDIVLGDYNEEKGGYPIQYLKAADGENGGTVSADISLPVDYYSCRIYAYRAEDTSEQKAIASDNTFGFRIYGGATTIVSGDLTENPDSYGTFDVPKIAIASIIPASDGSGTIEAKAAPASNKTEEGDEDTASTKVDFPEGTLSSTDATYSLEVQALSDNETNSAFTIESSAGGGKHELYGSVKLSLNEIKDNSSTAVENFTDKSGASTAVTVSVFIGKGIEDSITIKYVDEDGNVADETKQPTDVSYDKTTGIITFKTTHFSTFVVASKEPAPVYNVSQGRSYSSLEKAVKNLGSTTELLIQGTLPEAEKTITLDKNISLVIDLGEKTLTGFTIAAGKGSVTLRNGSVENITVNSGNVTFENVVSKNVSIGETYDGTITFEGGKLDGTESEYAFEVSEGEHDYSKRPTYVFRNLTVTTGTKRGIKIVCAKKITIENCTFDGKTLTADGDDAPYIRRSLSAVDIAILSSENLDTDITIMNSSFSNIGQGEDYPNDTAAAIKIKSQEPAVDGRKVGIGNVVIRNNTFTGCTRDVVIGKADDGNTYYSNYTKAAIDTSGNVIRNSGWTIEGNTSTAENVSILVYTDTEGNKTSKEIGTSAGGCMVYDISTAYEASIGEKNYLNLSDIKAEDVKESDVIVLYDCSKSNSIPDELSDKNWRVIHNNCDAEKEGYWHEASSLFDGGYGTKAEPYVIGNKEQFQNITVMYDKYAYYRVSDGYTELDLSEWSSVMLHGSFDGNNKSFTNVITYLFKTVGYKLQNEVITLKNFDVTFDASRSGSVTCNIFNSGSTTFDDVDVYGKIEDQYNIGSYYRYGTANYDGNGADYTVYFKDCKSDASLIVLGGTAGGFVGHAYEGNGHTFKMNTENSEYTGTIYSVDGNAGSKWVGTNSIYNGFYFNNEYLQRGTDFNKYSDKKAIMQVAPSSGDAGWTVNVAENASNIVVIVNAQLDAYLSDNTTLKPNANGITMRIASRELSVSETGVSAVLLEKVSSARINNSASEFGYTVTDGVMTVNVPGNSNYRSGTVRLIVSQYDSKGTILCSGTADVAKITNTAK